MIHFTSSLPRSGSTLLMNVLGQNPNHYVTPTSGLIELFVGIKNSWKGFMEFQAEGLEKVMPRIKGVMKGVLEGYFLDELIAGKVVFDKSRGWLQYIEELELALERPVKVLTMVRDVRDIVASFETLYQNRDIDFMMPVGDAYLQCQDMVGRCEHLLSPGGVVGLTISRLRGALQRKIKNRLMIVPFDMFTKFPKETMGSIHQHLNLPDFEYDFDNIEQVTFENDVYHGMKLHTIKNKIEPVEPKWESILPPDYAAHLAERYADINALANIN